MKSNIRLKSLIAISLVIFALPFFQTCSDSTIKKYQCLESNEFLVVKNLIHPIVKANSSKIKYKENQKDSCLEKAKKDCTVNAYSMGFGGYAEFESRYLTDKTFYIYSNFTLIILFTIITQILSFKKKYKQIMIFSSINLLLVFIWTISIYIIGGIEDINQIKYGYYLFVLNSILIFIESRKELNKQTE